MNDPEDLAAHTNRLKLLRQTAFVMPEAIEAHAHFGFGPSCAATFSPDTPIGEVYKWAALAQDTIRSSTRPARIVIWAGAAVPDAKE